VRLKAVSGEKSTVSLGKQFQILATGSVKKEDLTIQTQVSQVSWSVVKPRDQVYCAVNSSCYLR